MLVPLGSPFLLTPMVHGLFYSDVPNCPIIHPITKVHVKMMDEALGLWLGYKP